VFRNILIVIHNVSKKFKRRILWIPCTHVNHWRTHLDQKIQENHYIWKVEMQIQILLKSKEKSKKVLKRKKIEVEKVCTLMHSIKKNYIVYSFLSSFLFMTFFPYVIEVFGMETERCWHSINAPTTSMTYEKLLT
jgi:hypothetical protein